MRAFSPLWRSSLCLLAFACRQPCLGQALHIRPDAQIVNGATNQTVSWRGLSWFGFETQDFVVNGLWAHSMDYYLDRLRENGFNFLRVPFSAEWVLYNPTIRPTSAAVQADPSLSSLTSFEILDRLIDGCASRDMDVMLDLHRLHKEYISEVWYSPTDDLFPAEAFFTVWTTVLSRYANCSNVVAVDLLNEPHGRATWGAGDTSTDWNTFAELAITRLDTIVPNSTWLYVVEGVNWGHTFEGYWQAPFHVPAHLDARVVFSPHTYGKSVVPETSDDPQILRAGWDQSFGFLCTTFHRAILPGEWGGRIDLDATWMNHLADYLIDLGQRNNAFWSLGPNSGDVQGLLLDDWTTIDAAKMDVIARINPTPVSSRGT